MGYFKDIFKGFALFKLIEWSNEDKSKSKRRTPEMDEKLMKNRKVKKSLEKIDKQLDKYSKSVEKAAQGIDPKEFE